MFKPLEAKIWGMSLTLEKAKNVWVTFERFLTPWMIEWSTIWFRKYDLGYSLGEDRSYKIIQDQSSPCVLLKHLCLLIIINYSMDEFSIFLDSSNDWSKDDSAMIQFDRSSFDPIQDPLALPVQGPPIRGKGDWISDLLQLFLWTLMTLDIWDTTKVGGDM